MAPLDILVKDLVNHAPARGPLGGEPSAGIPGRGPPDNGPADCGGVFPNRGLSGLPGPHSCLGHHVLPGRGPGDANITLNTSCLDIPYTDVSRSMLQLLNAQHQLLTLTTYTSTLYVLMHLYGSHEFFTLTSSQFLRVFGIQFSSYCMRMYQSTTCIQDKYLFIFLIFISVSIRLNMEHSKQLKSITSSTITTGCLSYSSSYLKSF